MRATATATTITTITITTIATIAIAVAAALRLYLPSADVTVIRRLYIATRHWSKARASSSVSHYWDLLKVYFVDLKSRLKNAGCEDSTPEDILKQSTSNTLFIHISNDEGLLCQRRARI